MTPMILVISLEDCSIFSIASTAWRTTSPDAPRRRAGRRASSRPPRRAGWSRDGGGDLLQRGGGLLHRGGLLLGAPRQVVGGRADLVRAGVDAAGVLRPLAERVLQVRGGAVEVPRTAVEVRHEGLSMRQDMSPPASFDRAPARLSTANLISAASFAALRSRAMRSSSPRLRLASASLLEARLLPVVFEQHLERAGEIADLVFDLAVLQFEREIALGDLRRLADDIGDAADEAPRDQPAGKREQRRRGGDDQGRIPYHRVQLREDRALGNGDDRIPGDLRRERDRRSDGEIGRAVGRGDLVLGARLGDELGPSGRFRAAFGEALADQLRIGVANDPAAAAHQADIARLHGMDGRECLARFDKRQVEAGDAQRPAFDDNRLGDRGDQHVLAVDGHRDRAR
uniref:hypothetical protein n=1 Tax=Thauera sp. SDU_THAU2 TaxID=3136633 RepID=UPI00311D4EC9